VIVFEVLLNGRLFARAGAEDLGVLSTHVTGVGKLGRRSRGTVDAPKNYDLDLEVGGLTSRTRRADDHLHWGTRRSLKVGDEVTVRISEATTADAPSRSVPSKRPPERKQYEFAKALYFKLRPKFERKRLSSRSTAAGRKRSAR